MEPLRVSIQDLRASAYGSWEIMHFERNACIHGPFQHDTDESTAKRLPYTNSYFKSEIRKQFGDLRLRTTWEKAAIHYSALSLGTTYCLEPYQILCCALIPDYLGYDAVFERYQSEIFDRLMEIPQFIEMIKAGLEQIYREDELVKERQQIEQFRHQLPAVA